MPNGKEAAVLKRKLQTPRVVRIGILCLAVFFAISFLHLQVEIRDRESKLNELQTQVDEQQAVNDALRDQVENGVSDEYIASIAREHGYVMPNERVFKDASSK